MGEEVSIVTFLLLIVLLFSSPLTFIFQYSFWIFGFFCAVSLFGGLYWPGDGVNNGDWLSGRRMGGDRNPAKIVCTIIDLFVKG